MNKTEHYQLNQWDPEDRLLRMDFNADNTAIETALKENAETIAAESAARAAADTAVRTDFAAADTAIRSEFAAADTKIRTDFAAADNTIKSSVTSEATTRANQDAAIRSEFAAADATLRSENCMVKLLDTTTTSATSQINLSVGNLNLSQYAYVVIIPRIKFASSATQEVYTRFNNLSSSIYYQKGSSSAYGPTFKPCSGYSTTERNGSTVITLTTSAPNISMFIENQESYYMTSSCVVNSSSLAPTSLSTINFFVSNNTLAAGSRIVVYGVKW